MAASLGDHVSEMTSMA